MILFLVSTPYFLRHPESWAIFLRHNLQATGALDAGNHGLIRLVFLLVRDYHLGSITEEWQWERLVSHIRLSVLAATTMIVLLRGNKHIVIGASALVLAHFLTYQHVWEHHMSAVLVIGALMLTVNEIPKWFTVTVLASMVCLALPTPFVFFDTLKDPSVFDPSFDWPLYASYLEVLPKVLPTMALYFACVGMLLKHGSWPTVNILRRVALINH